MKDISDDSLGYRAKRQLDHSIVKRIAVGSNDIRGAIVGAGRVGSGPTGINIEAHSQPGWASGIKPTWVARAVGWVRGIFLRG